MINDAGIIDRLALDDAFSAMNALSCALNRAIRLGCFSETQGKILSTYMDGMEDFFYPLYLYKKGSGNYGA